VVQEKNKKYVFENLSRQEVCKIRVDCCFIPNQEQRKYDFLILVCDLETVYLVELKGKDLISAVEQLTQTLESLKANLVGQVFARVVLSKSPNPRVIENDARVRRLRKLLKKYRGDFDYGSRLYTEKIKKGR
jgi:hypothetical protein